MKYILIGLAVASMSVAPFACRAEEAQENLPEECSQPNPDCRCSAASVTGKSAQTGCVFLTLGLGRTTPWTDARPLTLKVFEMKASPMLFTPESLYVTLDYAYKGVGNADLPDGTPREVDFGLPEGEPLRFSFAPGESVAAPAPGISARRPERLMMVDAEGWAVTNAPVYWDLNVGNGDVWRFLASDATGERGKLVSFRDVRGRVFTGADFGLDVVRDANGVRQVVTPARLADVTALADGYDVRVWPLAAPPEVDPATGLYAVPDAAPVRTLSVRREREGRRLVATFDEGAAPERYVFDYAGGEWTLAAPSGVRSVKEREQTDEDRARIRRRDYAADGTLLAQTVDAYAWTSWGFARTNRVEGFGGVTRTTAWTYVLSGTGRGNVRARTEQTGRVTSYAYDAAGRVASETETGPGAPTNRVEYAYAPLVSDDHAAAVDTRPRTVVRRVDGIECGRTYYVYTALTDVVERAAAQGAPYGATNALRTVTAYHPADAPDGAAGRVRSVRREDGRLDAYAYALADGIWTTTVTHLHERAPSPAEGRTTRDVTRVNARNETVERRTEAFVGGAWRVVARTSYVHDAEGRVVRETDLAGRVTETGWDCCRKISESRPDGSRTTYAYDADGRLVAESRLTALDLTNDTWVTTCHRHDGLGRVVATWTTNYEHGVGGPVKRICYDALGREIVREGENTGKVSIAYSKNELISEFHYSDGASRLTEKTTSGDLKCIDGTANVKEFYDYSVRDDGMRITTITLGMTNGIRRSSICKNVLGKKVRSIDSGSGGVDITTEYHFDVFGNLTDEVKSFETNGINVIFERNLMKTISHESRKIWCKDRNLNGIIDYQGEDQINEECSYYIITNGLIAYETVVYEWPIDNKDEKIEKSRRREFIATTNVVAKIETRDSLRNLTTSCSRECLGLEVLLENCVSSSVPRIVCQKYGRIVMEGSFSAVTNYWIYDVLGRMHKCLDSYGRIIEMYSYDKDGRVSTRVDRNGTHYNYTYDVRGRAVRVATPISEEIREYDLRGNLVTRITDGRRVEQEFNCQNQQVALRTFRGEDNQYDMTSWEYDNSTGLLLGTTYADGSKVHYRYSPDGLLLERIWARGIMTKYTYDASHRLTRIDYSDDTPTQTFQYDRLDRVMQLIVEGVTTNTIRYSLDGRKIVDIQNAGILTYDYDKIGRQIGLYVGNDYKTQYGYDALGRISSVGTGNVKLNYQRFPGTDKVSRKQFGEFVQEMSLDENNMRILAITNMIGSEVYSSFTYGFDEYGRKNTVEWQRPFGLAGRDEYGYDSNSFLTEIFSSFSQPQSTSMIRQNTYDHNGNCTMYTVVSNGVETALIHQQINNLNQITSLSSTNDITSSERLTCRYDRDGNLLNYGAFVYQWNGENRLVSVYNTNENYKVLYLYDGVGRMIQESYTNYVTGAGRKRELIWDDFNIICVKQSQGHSVLKRYFSYGPDVEGSLHGTAGVGGLAFMKQNEKIQIALNDGYGNVQGYVSEDGETTAEFRYDGYRPINMFILSEQESDLPQFNTMRYDSELKLLHYVFRSFSTDLGIWLNRDPCGELGFSKSPVHVPLIKPSPENLYLFLNNSPIDSYDKFGLDSAGCDVVGNIPFWETDCRLKCCAKHDLCYDVNKCKADTWKHTILPFTCDTPCDKCNKEVVTCTLICSFTPFDPNPNGNRYYCAKIHDYVEKKEDCNGYSRKCKKWKMEWRPRGERVPRCIEYY